jgi:hypothetical protein
MGKAMEIAKMLKELKITFFFILPYYKLKNGIFKQVYVFCNG